MLKLFCLGRGISRFTLAIIEVSCSSLLPTKKVERENTCDWKHWIDCFVQGALNGSVSWNIYSPPRASMAVINLADFEWNEVNLSISHGFNFNCSLTQFAEGEDSSLLNLKCLSPAPRLLTNLPHPPSVTIEIWAFIKCVELLLDDSFLPTVW